MRRFNRLEKIISRFLIILFFLGVASVPLFGAASGNRLFEIILKGSASALKDQLSGEKDDLLKAQGMMLAIANNKMELVPILLENQADLGTRLDDAFDISPKDKFDPEGETFLHRATRLGRVEIVKLLLKKGAPVNREDRQGRSPLDVANAILNESESPDETKDGGKTGSPTTRVNITPKVREISEILEEAGGKSLKSDGILPIVIGVIVVCVALGGFFFMRLRNSAQAEGAKHAKGKVTGKSPESGDWLTEAATIADRHVRAKWVELCMAKSGKRQEGAAEEMIQASDAFTVKYFPKTASFSAKFSLGELRLEEAFIVNQPSEIVPLPRASSKKEWKDLPGVKGSVIMIDKEKIARNVFAAFSKIAQLNLKLDSAGEVIEGYKVKREDTGWKCSDPSRVELELTLDSRGRLDTAKGKVFFG